MGTHSRYPHPPCICAAFRAAGFFRTNLLSHQLSKPFNLPVFSHIFKNDNEETEIGTSHQSVYQSSKCIGCVYLVRLLLTGLVECSSELVSEVNKLIFHRLKGSRASHELSDAWKLIFFHFHFFQTHNLSAVCVSVYLQFKCQISVYLKQSLGLPAAAGSNY